MGQPDSTLRIATAVPLIPAVGDVLVGKYRIERMIGAGGMGMVVLARHLQLEHSVAIKFMLPNLRTSAEARERFLREARAAARLKGDHVARILDYGTLDTDAPFIVMEYLEGRDLAAILEERGRLEIDEAVAIVTQTCEAIAEAHSLGIVHRDLKPENLFVTRRSDGSPFVKVLDFGISKIMSNVTQSHRRTRSSALMGSLRYMSPEQMTDAAEVDGRTDLWALGVILYECLAGTPPFRAQGIPQLCSEVMREREPRLRSYRPEIPETLESVVHHCLEKDREVRIPNAEALLAALRGSASQPGLAPRYEPAGPSFPPVAMPAELDLETTVMEREIRARSRSRWPFVFTGMLLGAAGVLGYLNSARIHAAARQAAATALPLPAAETAPAVVTSPAASVPPVVPSPTPIAATAATAATPVPPPPLRSAIPAKRSSPRSAWQPTPSASLVTSAPPAVEPPPPAAKEVAPPHEREAEAPAEDPASADDRL